MLKILNIQYQTFDQNKGDIVCLGPGTLHWVKGTGKSLHSSYNIFWAQPKFI